MNAFTNAVKSLLPGRIKPVFKKTVFSLRSIYFSGTDLKCPICKGRFRQMLPFGQKYQVLQSKKVIGGGFRENCLCPRCNSSDRERLVYLYIKHMTKLLNPGTSLLHIAPEANLGNIFNNKNYKYLSGDLRSEAAMMQMDVTCLPLEDESFDAVICNHVLEHVPDDRKAMSEFFRVLKPEGTAILQVPVSRIMNETIEDLSINNEDTQIEKFGQRDHVRIYAATDYISRLISIGFQVEEFDWTIYQEFDPLKNKYSLNPAERVFAATKPAA